MVAGEKVFDLCQTLAPPGEPFTLATLLTSRRVLQCFGFWHFRQIEAAGTASKYVERFVFIVDFDNSPTDRTNTDIETQNPVHSVTSRILFVLLI